MMKRVILVLLAIAMLCSMFATGVFAAEEEEPIETEIETEVETEPIEPVEPEDIKHSAYINGDASGKFLPGNTMSRAEMAQMIYNMMELPEGTARFSDVKETSWYAKAVNALAEAKILNGYPDGTAKPGNPVSRAEFVKVLANMKGEDSYEKDCSFTDVLKGSWMYPVICLAQGNGWINGYSDGSFKPNATITRAEAVTVLNRFLGRVPDEEAIKNNPAAKSFPDVFAGTWYYWNVMEAAITHTCVFVDGQEEWQYVQYDLESYADGFNAIGGKLYLIIDHEIIRQCGESTYNGVDFSCDEKTGICKVDREYLELADGRICVLKNGEPWTNKGYFEYNNALYYCDKNGVLMQNGKVGTMYFGPDGKYTTGNATIDTFVNGVVTQVTTPGMSKEEKLRACYKYVYDHISYLGNNNHVPRGADPSTWTEEYMLRLIAIGRGNCYSYAAEMYYLARRVGYGQAEAISGRFGSGRGGHGWLEIVIDGIPYLCDPEVNWKYLKWDPYALFMKKYGDVGYYYGR